MRLNKFVRLLEEKDWTIYMDMDGVLCNFLKSAAKVTGRNLKNFEQWGEIKKDEWQKITAAGSDFWANLEWLSDGKELWNYIKGMNVEILSAYPVSPQGTPNAIKGKKEWLKKNLPGIKKINLVKGIDKQKYAHTNAILIDDSGRNIKQFKAAGGIGILHKNTKDTIAQLKKVIG